MGTMLDLRRTDLRSNVLENPYWITSLEINKDCDDLVGVLFSFPITSSVSPGYGNSIILIHDIVVEFNTAFVTAADITLDIGQYSLATDAITSAGTATLVDIDMYYDDVDGSADCAAEGLYVPDSESAWLIAKAAGTWGTNQSIVAADTTVLCIAATLTSTSEVTAGSAYVHALISRVPVVS